MLPIRQIAPGAVKQWLRDLPLSAGKVALAWRQAVGSRVDRATAVSLRPNGTLDVRVSDEHWRREVERSAGMIRDRLDALLGRGVVSGMAVTLGRHEPEREPTGDRRGPSQRR